MVIRFQFFGGICFRNFAKNTIKKSGRLRRPEKTLHHCYAKTLYMVICFSKFLKFSENVIYGIRYIWWSITVGLAGPRAARVAALREFAILTPR